MMRPSLQALHHHVYRPRRTPPGSAPLQIQRRGCLPHHPHALRALLKPAREARLHDGYVLDLRCNPGTGSWSPFAVTFRGHLSLLRTVAVAYRSRLQYRHGKEEDAVHHESLISSTHCFVMPLTFGHQLLIPMCTCQTTIVVDPIYMLRASDRHEVALPDWDERMTERLEWFGRVIVTLPIFPRRHHRASLALPVRF